MAPSTPPIRVGYVPEHFSTPLHFSIIHHNSPPPSSSSQGATSSQPTLHPYPSGTGHMITALQSQEIDIAIGLTEAWVAGLGKAWSETKRQQAGVRENGEQGKATGNGAGYRLVGRYVETPLCWAVSCGNRRGDLVEGGVEGLKGGKMGVSRIGSGSHVMGYVLADQQGWLNDTATPPFEVVPLQTFEKLRAGVSDGTIHFFMWEHFTTKKYYDSGEVKRVGEIRTPWESWGIVARDGLLAENGGEQRVEGFLERLNQGVEWFKGHEEEAVVYICKELGYQEEDARDWLKTVRFASDVRGVDRGTVGKVVETLKKAGVLEGDVGDEAVGVMAASWK